MNRSSLSRAVMTVAVLTAFGAMAGPDTFFVGNGRSATRTFGSGEVVVNNYAQVTQPLAPGDNEITIGTPTGVANEPSSSFNVNSLVLVLQTTGLVPATAEGDAAPIDLTENPVGRWELARISGVLANSKLQLAQPLKYSYAANVTQVIVVPEYVDLTINSGVTVKARPWDGSTGGVVAFLVSMTLTNNGTISAKGAGFRGGVYARVNTPGSSEFTGCTATTTPTGAPREVRAAKGEGLNNALYNPDPTLSAINVGSLANGGGGGICNHGGGGGGGNAGVGGRGGGSEDGNRDEAAGQGGASVRLSPLQTLSMGGGGGSGQGYVNKSSSNPPEAGRGGGVVFIRARTLAGAGSINASGGNAPDFTDISAGGGGAGGTVYARFAQSAACDTVLANGGNGGNTPTAAGSRVFGPGGGGGGGWVLFQAQSIQCYVTVDSGVAGTSGISSTDTRNAQPFPGGGVPYVGTAITISKGIVSPAAPTLSTPANNSSTRELLPGVSGSGIPNTNAVMYLVDAAGNIVGGEVARAKVQPNGSFAARLTQPLASGLNRLVAATESLGLQGPIGAQTLVTLDTVEPTSVFTSTLPGSPVGTPSTTFTFQAQDNGEQTACSTCTLQCSINGGDFTDCSSGTLNVSTNDSDTYTLWVRAIDAVGNEQLIPLSHTWRVDRTRPDTAIAVKPPQKSRLDTAEFSFTSPSSDVASFQCVLDPAPTPPTEAQWSAAPACTAREVRTVAHGTHQMWVRAVDTVGNVDDTPASHQWTVDLHVPDTSIVSGPPPVTRETTADFTFASFEQAQPSAACGSDCSVYCSLDGAAFVLCPAQYTGLGEGTHTLLAQAQDTSGNVDPSPASRSWRVDLTRPDTQIVTRPTDPSPAKRAGFDFNSGDSDVARFECALLTRTGPPLESEFTTCGASYETPANGLVHGLRYALHVRAVDAVGNADNTPASYQWTVDLHVPDTSIVSGPPSLDSTTTPTFVFASFDQYEANEAARVPCPDCTLECSLNGAPFAPCPGTHNPTVQERTNTMMVRAKDLAGNVDETPAVHTWRVILGPVTMQIDDRPPTTVTRDPVASFRFTASKPECSYECKFGDATAFTPCPLRNNIPETAQYTATVSGIYRLTVRARDKSNNVSEPVQATWTVDIDPPQPPIVTSPRNSALLKASRPLIEGTSPEQGSVSVYIDDALVGTFVSGSTWAFNGSPVLADGSHKVAVELTDLAGNKGAMSAPVRFEVDATPPQTSITRAPNSLTADANSSFEFSSTEEVRYWCSLDRGEPKPCEPVHPVTVRDGAHSLEVQAEDLAGNRDATPSIHAWTVDTDPPSTTINEKPGVAVNVRSASFRMDSDEPRTDFQYSLDGSSFTDCGALLTLNNLAEGRHRLEVRARDEARNLDDSVEVVEWTVDLTRPAVPVLSQPAPEAVLGILTPTFSGTAEVATASQAENFVVVSIGDKVVGRTRVESDGSWRVTPANALSEGALSVSVVSEDAAGNVSEPSTSMPFTIDLAINRPREIDSRGGGLSCAATAPGGAPFAAVGLLGLVLLAARRRRW